MSYAKMNSTKVGYFGNTRRSEFELLLIIYFFVLFMNRLVFFTRVKFISRNIILNRKSKMFASRNLGNLTKSLRS